MTSETIAPALEVVGTIAFAMSGATAAARREFDVFGVIALGSVVAVGGGTLRDILLGRPTSWIFEWWPLAVAGLTALATIPVVHRIGSDVDERRIVLVADALGLATFAILGTERSLDAGAPGVTAVVLGTVSGIAGGVFRDVLCGVTPIVFGGQIYALAAAAGAGMYIGLRELSAPTGLGYWLPVAAIVALRLVALRRAWSVPVVRARP